MYNDCITCTNKIYLYPTNTKVHSPFNDIHKNLGLNYSLCMAIYRYSVDITEQNF